MRQEINHGTTDGAASARIGARNDEFLLFFTDLASFSKAVEAETGLTFNFASAVEIHTNFLESSDQYLILNVKGDSSGNPNNLLFLTDHQAVLYSEKPPQPEAFKIFEAALAKPFGQSTVLAFLTLHKVLESYEAKLETLITAVNELEQSFSYAKYRELASELERLQDRLEALHDLILKLQERGIKQVATEYISFDYSVLIAESVSLEERCGRRLNMLRDLARDHEMQAAAQLNTRIEKLNDIVKKLTAITVILMLPTLIASHFGMNFVHMPELKIPWAYPAVIIFQIVLMGVGVIIFRRIGWL